MKKRMIVMTVSSKNRGYCVAGIDIKTHRWIRLVTEDKESKGALSSTDLLCNDGRRIEVLDVIEVDVICELPTEIQPENFLLDTSECIYKVSKKEFDEALGYLEQPKIMYIFGNTYPYAKEAKVRGLGYSLILVEVTDLWVKQVFNKEKEPKTKVDFIYYHDKYENLAVTDPDFYLKDLKVNKAYLVISIGASYNDNYYKFVSKIFIK